MTRALLVVAGVVLWVVASAVYFHETHVRRHEPEQPYCDDLFPGNPIRHR
jgi:hypothetical protein